MDQISAACRFFAHDAWVRSLEWREADQVLEVTLVNRAALRRRRFVLGVAVSLLVPTGEGYPYLWFVEGGGHDGSSGGGSADDVSDDAVRGILERANEALEDRTVGSIGLVAVVSSLVLRFRERADEVWPPLPATPATPAPSSALHRQSEQPRFELRRRDAEQRVVADTIRTNPRGTELLLLLLQLAANNAGFERLCSPFPDVFRDDPSPARSAGTTSTATRGGGGGGGGGGGSGREGKRGLGRPQIARLRRTLIDLPPLAGIPATVDAFYEAAQAQAGAGAGAEGGEEKAGVRRDQGALPDDVVALLFWLFEHGPFRVVPSAGAGNRGNGGGRGGGGTGSSATAAPVPTPPPQYESFDVVHRVRVPHFATQAAEHGQIRAYHGSHATNWYSIVSNKLQNLSGTEHQANGAVFGKGVYLARGASVANVFANVCKMDLRHCQYAQPPPPRAAATATTPTASADRRRRGSGGRGAVPSTAAAAGGGLLHGLHGATKAAVSVLAECAVVQREQYCRHLDPARAAAAAAAQRRRGHRGAADKRAAEEDDEVDDSLYIVVNNAEDLELRRVLVKVTSVGGARAQWLWVLFVALAVGGFSVAWNAQFV